MDEAITSKIVTAQSIETKLLEQQTRQVRNHQYSLMTKYEVPSTHDAWLRPPHCSLTTGDLRVSKCY